MLVFSVLAIPLIASVLLALMGHKPWAYLLNAGMTLLTFIDSLLLAKKVLESGPILVFRETFYVDSFNIFLISLTAFVGLTTAIFSGPYMKIEEKKGKVTPKILRLYHSAYQIFLFTMLLALFSNNLGILWVSIEGATLATVLLVSLYRTRASIEAAWKYFILCGVGISQALFGTILLYFAAEKILGPGGGALLWTHLFQIRFQLEPTVLKIAFVFLLVGYGTKVGLAPLHNWLPDAHAEGPTPISAVLSGLLLNVALYALVRCKVLVDGALHTNLASEMMMGFGLLSMLVAVFSMLRRKDVKRLFAYSSIEHMGIATFAFGLGGALATFAALLHMTVHSLTKSSIFFSVGHATQINGTQQMSQIQGLLKRMPRLGWGLLLGSFAILGMPPFGVFASEFIVLTVAMKQVPWTTPILLLCLAVAFGVIFFRVGNMVLGEGGKENLSHPPALFPVFLHLALVLVLGIFIPPFLAHWYQNASRFIG